jgi:hypothetical protein
MLDKVVNIVQFDKVCNLCNHAGPFAFLLPGSTRASTRRERAEHALGPYEVLR